MYVYTTHVYSSFDLCMRMYDGNGHRFTYGALFLVTSKESPGVFVEKRALESCRKEQAPWQVGIAMDPQKKN